MTISGGPEGTVISAFLSQDSLLDYVYQKKDMYLTPFKSTISTRSSHNSQYCRPQTYGDALKYPRTFSDWNRLAPSVVTEEFRALI